MKKLFTLLLTLVFALTVSAAPGTPKKGTMVKVTPFEKTMTMKSATSAKVKKAPMFHEVQPGMNLKKDGKTVNISRTTKMARPTSATKMNKAPRKADGETIDLNITGTYNFAYSDPTDEHPTGDWYFGAADDTNSFVVRLNYLATKENKYGTFTLDDLDPEYSFIVDYTSTEEDNYYYYMEGTTFTVSKKDGHDVIQGTLICDNGKTYNLYVEHIPETIDIEATELSTAAYFSSDMDWYVIFQNDEYSVTLDLLSPDGEFDGVYTEEDALINYCGVTKLETYDSFGFEKLNATLRLLEGSNEPSMGCEITGTGVSVNGDVYNFHLLVNPPITPKEVVNIDVDLKTAEWPSDRGVKSYFEVTEKNNPNLLWNLGLEYLQGTLTEEYISKAFTGRVNTETGESISLDHGTIVETFNHDTYVVTVDADLVMTDSIEYKFSFDYAIETKGEANYNYTNIVLDSSWYGWFGVQWITASDDETSFSMTLAADVPGEYDDTNAYASITSNDEEGNEKTVHSVAMLHASTTLDTSNQPVLDCSFLGDDMVVYNVNACFKVPEPKDTVNVVMNGLSVETYFDTNGMFEVYGYNETKDKYLLLIPQATQIPGHYTTEDLAAYADYNYLVFINPEDSSYVINKFYYADFDVTQNDRDVTVVGKFQAGDHWVNLTVNATTVIQGLDYDVSDDDCDVTFTKEDLSELVKYENQGYAYVRLQNAERNDCFAMLIYLNQYDDVTMFPEGTYEINGTYEPNTVQQGCLSSDYSQVYPTFYALCDDEGYLYLPLWQFRSGTVKVMKDKDGELAFEVNAQNSFERTCHIAYNLSNTGINNVNAENTDSVRKMIENKQVVIRKGDQKFTVIGQELK